MEKRILDEEEEENQSKRCKSVDLYETGFILKDLWLEMLDTVESESDRLFNLLWSFRSCPSWVGRGAPREIIRLIAHEAATLVSAPVCQAIEKQHFTLTYICQVHNSVFDCCAEDEDEDQYQDEYQDDEEEDDDDKMYFMLSKFLVYRVTIVTIFW
jgi:hypothetical protein